MNKGSKWTQGHKLTQDYGVCIHKFQKEDFGDDEPFDPTCNFFSLIAKML
jgi:hypothetical protein